MKRATMIVAMAGAVLVLTAFLRAADPNQTYQATYGDDARKVTSKDAAAFAQRLIADSARLKDDMPVAELLLVKAQELYNRFPLGEDRPMVAEALIERWLAVANAMLSDDRAAEALGVLDKASKLALAAKSPRLADIQDRTKAFKARVEVDKKLADLLARIKEKPDDAPTAKALVLAYVLDLDQPGKAAPYVQAAGDEELTTYVPLAAKEPPALEEQALKDLGGWYARQAKKAGPFGKTVAYTRAKGCYELFLAKHGKQDMEVLQVKKALASVDKELDELSALGAAMARGAQEIALDCGNSVKMKLVLIPPGRFLMGSPEKEAGRQPNEGPQRPVTISKPFYMGVTEVTQAQYEAVMGKNPSKFKDPNYPVEGVSWDAAAEFCKKLSEETRKTVRLPTEAQWEYACRAGTTTAYSFGDDGRKLGDFAWFGGNSAGKTNPVGQKKPNPAGLYDMHGNVWEWCSDWHDEKYYANARNVDPQGPDMGSVHVLRGGRWGNSPDTCRSAYRCRITPGLVDGYFFGFRVVCAVGSGDAD